MKLIRFGNVDNEQPGIYADGKRYDISSVMKDYDEMFFATGQLNSLPDILKNIKQFPEVPESVRWAAPVARPSKIICIGLNYADHAKESNMQLPAEPVIFFKSTTSMAGPYDDVVIPKNSKKTDWEVELAVVIGRRASYIEEDQASGFIAGYCLHNDYSEREFQLERAGQWVKGKSCDTFAPLGPWLVTPDEMKDVNKLRLWLTVNGQTKQESNTSNLVFKVPYLVAYLSQFMTLLPGDVISTGTPGGVGLAQKPVPEYLKPGDVIELGIDGLGCSKQRAIAWKANNQ